MAVALETVRVYELLKDKLGDEASRELLHYVDSRIEREVATNATLRTDLEKQILSIKTDLERRIDGLGWQQRLYFVVLLAVILGTNPALLEFVARILGLIR